MAGIAPVDAAHGPELPSTTSMGATDRNGWRMRGAAIYARRAGDEYATRREVAVARIVDVHAHALVPGAGLPAGSGPGVVGSRLFAGDVLCRLVDLDVRLAEMDAAGVDVQAVSVVPEQYHREADRRRAAELVCVVNDGLAGLVRRAPDRLVGIGTVALQHPDLAAEQLRRAVDDYDFRGVQIPPCAGGRDLSDRAFDPFWAIAEALTVPVFVRPPGCGPGDPPPVDAVLDRFPTLVVCAAPGAGCPTRRYVDACVRSPGALRRLVDATGAGGVLLGSDYPFGTGTRPLPALLDDVAPAGRAAVGGGTARALLRLV
jgi:aminocarboxymuconate-semialdehyde decarboxylase